MQVEVRAGISFNLLLDYTDNSNDYAACSGVGVISPVGEGETKDDNE